MTIFCVCDACSIFEASLCSLSRWILHIPLCLKVPLSKHCYLIKMFKKKGSLAARKIRLILTQWQKYVLLLNMERVNIVIKQSHLWMCPRVKNCELMLLTNSNTCASSKQILSVCSHLTDERRMSDYALFRDQIRGLKWATESFPFYFCYVRRHHLFTALLIGLMYDFFEVLPSTGCLHTVNQGTDAAPKLFTTEWTFCGLLTSWTKNKCSTACTAK